MKILTAAQMREFDRHAIEAGFPSPVLMENAGCRVVEYLVAHYAPISSQRIVIVCGKGNNGGDGLVIARQLKTRFAPASLDVVLSCAPADLAGDAATNYQLAVLAGVSIVHSIEPRLRAATLVVDALLGTGLSGPARGAALNLIREINTAFPAASIVSVDTPSGLCDSGEFVRASATVTFVAPKLELVIPPTCDHVGHLEVASIGTPQAWLDDDPTLDIELIEPRHICRLFAPRPRAAHKGIFGHALVIGGAPGKGGAAAMAGLAALKAGAGLVTVAASEFERATVTSLAPELMTQSWSDDASGKDVLAIGPGLGREPEAVALAQRLFAQSALPMVVDADALNALAGTAFHGPGPWRVMTPHPGEMCRLAGCTMAELQAGRLGRARHFAVERSVVLVLKGQRTIVALPDGRAYVNPTGTPAMATAGSGDILTGLIAGLLAQWPDRRAPALLAAVWLHGRAGELAAASLTENAVTATDILRYLPAAIRELQS
jgi:NAD(P)H-hydrate epimerase